MNRSNLIDRILADICLDQRVTDGIFRIDENAHMEAFREYLCEHGLTIQDSIDLSNKMLEGKYPERQAYRKEDGLLVTWPSPEYKKKAMSENPGKYVDENPFPKGDGKKEPIPDGEKLTDEPSEPSEPSESPEEKQQRAAHLFNTSVNQDGKSLKVEPPKNATATPPPTQQPSTPEVPATPQQKMATKIVAAQVFGGDNIELGGRPVEDPLTTDQTSLTRQSINELLNSMTSTQLQDAHEFIKNNYFHTKK